MQQDRRSARRYSRWFIGNRLWPEPLNFYVMNHMESGSEQKSRVPPFGGPLDQKRLSCTICGDSDSEVEFPDIFR